MYMLYDMLYNPGDYPVGKAGHKQEAMVCAVTWPQFKVFEI